MIDPLPGPSATLFGADGSFLAGFSLGTWSTNGTHVVADTATTPGVMDLQFLADGGNGITTIGGGPVNLANYAATGKLSFEVKVVSWGTNTAGLAIKMESPGDGCRNIDYVVPQSAVPVDGQFHAVVLDVADVAAQKNADCFSLENISVPFGIFPVWDQQQGVHFQVRNVGMSAP